MNKLNFTVLDNTNLQKLWNNNWGVFNGNQVYPYMSPANANVSSFLYQTLEWYILQKTWNFDFSNLDFNTTQSPAAYNYINGLSVNLITTWAMPLAWYWNNFQKADISVASPNGFGTTSQKTQTSNGTKSFNHNNTRNKNKNFSENESETRNNFFNEMVKTGESTQNITNPQSLNAVLNSANEQQNNLNFSDYGSSVNANVLTAQNRANVDNGSENKTRTNDETAKTLENQTGNETDNNNFTENETSYNTMEVWGKFVEWIQDKNINLQIIEWLEKYTKNARLQVSALVYFKNTSWGWF